VYCDRFRTSYTLKRSGMKATARAGARAAAARAGAAPERLRGVFTTRRYTNPHLPLPLSYLIMIEQGLMSRQTHYRSYRRRFLQVI